MKIKYLIPTAMVALSPLSAIVSCGGSKDHSNMVVTDGGSVTDKSFNQQAYEALQEITGRKLTNSDYIEPKPGFGDAKSIENAYDSAAKLGAKVVLAPGFFHVAPLQKYKNTKNLKFLLIDGEVKQPYIASIKFDTKLVGFEAGYMAASYENLPNSKGGPKTSHYKVGIFGGNPFPGVTDYMVGFVEGVKYFDSNLQAGQKKVTFSKFADAKDYTNSGFAPGDKGKALSNKLINEGADVIVPVAGPVVQDTINAINSSKKNIKIIGVDTDQSKAYPKDASKFLTSILKNLHKAFVDVYNVGIKKQTIKNINGFGKLTMGDFSNGLIGLANPTASYKDIYNKSTQKNIQTEAKKIDGINWATALKDLQAL